LENWIPRHRFGFTPSVPKLPDKIARAISVARELAGPRVVDALGSLPAMKKSSFSLAAVALAAAFCFSGCDTFNSRAREKSAVYNSLPASTQQRLERGKINVGDTQDMVYIALGNPEEKRDVTTASGTQTVWVYKTYWEQYEGSAWVGWHRVIVPAPNGRGYMVYHEPITQDLYRTHVDEVIRVTFANGVVSTVEQQKR
jgi:outer membrane protein assembly factor BamE (lipoprotein component of BamABCDE complex)